MIMIQSETEHNWWSGSTQNSLPNSQNATQTFGSAPWNNAPSCARKRAHEADGAPGRGSIRCSDMAFSKAKVSALRSKYCQTAKADIGLN